MASDEPALPDGTYDAFVVDATEHGDLMELALAITSGEHKGEVLTVNATGLPGSDIDLLGLPATLTVADGNPSVRIDG